MGIPGGIAGGIQLSSLYWLRTIIKYQYVNPQTLRTSSRNLWRDTDRFRLYRGFIPNFSKVFLGKVGESSLIKHYQPQNKNDILTTLFNSGRDYSLKTLMMPLDTIGNSYQVNGLKSQEIIRHRQNTGCYHFMEWNSSVFEYFFYQLFDLGLHLSLSK